MFSADETHTPPSSGRHAEDGFVLFAALLLLGVIAALASIFAFQVKLRTRVLAHEVEIVRRSLAIESAESFGVLQVLSPIDRFPNAQGWQLERICMIGNGMIARIRIRDEAGKVDLNSADDRLLLAALIDATGSRTLAETLLDEIVDYRDTDNDARIRGAELDTYRARDLSYGPKNEHFETLEELLQVPSMTVELFGRLRPHLTLQTRQPGIDPNYASLAVLRALVELTGVVAGSTTTTTMSRDALSALMPSELRSTSRGAHFEIETTGVAPNGSAIAYSTVVERASQQHFAIRARSRIHGFEALAAPTAGVRPDVCWKSKSAMFRIYSRMKS